ncbi:MAG TPA: hypothetical protein VFL69_05875 [Marmoricola sp.]|nr:hypothetical protein [Marmoricola sp.]
MKRLARAGATLAAAGLVGLGAGPALAAGTVSRASANAIDLDLLGSSQSSGTFTATDDGSGQVTSGRQQPAIGVLTGQRFLEAGTLGQDASARVVGRRGHSAACAGLAGDGATLVGVGSGQCLAGGNNLQLTAGAIDLGHVQLVQSDLLQGVPQQLQGPISQQLDLSALSDAVDQVLARAGSGLTLDADALQAVCHAAPGSATGRADIADASVNADLSGTPVSLVHLPVNPPPNTDVVVDLHKVLDAVLQGVRTDLTTTVDGQLAPLADVTDQVKQQVVDNGVAQVDQQLQPLSDNVLRIILNEQSRPAPGAIEVTALDLTVLPAAQPQLHRTVAHARIGTVTCGPEGRVAAPAQPAVKPPRHAKVPRAVPAGEATLPPGTGPDHAALAGAGALAGLLAVSGVAGTAAYRRHLRG